MTGETLDARCRSCGHIWTVAHLPMEVEQVARLALNAACPKCATPNPHVAFEKPSPVETESLPLMRLRRNGKDEEMSEAKTDVLLEMYYTEDGEPWALIAPGHVDKAAFFTAAQAPEDKFGAQIDEDMAGKTLEDVEHVYVNSSPDLELIVFCTADDEDAQPMTAIRF